MKDLNGKHKLRAIAAYLYDHKGDFSAIESCIYKAYEVGREDGWWLQREGDSIEEIFGEDNDKTYT